MRIVFVIFVVLFTSNVWGIDYYCPRSDVYFNFMQIIGVSNKDRFGASGRYSDAFQKNISDSNLSFGAISFQVNDCSVDKFECLHFLIKQTNKNDYEFSLFSPHYLEQGKEYHFKGMRLLSKVATISPFMTEISSEPPKNRVPIIQSTVWQKINGIETAIKLTIEDGKGIVFFDGINIWPEKFNIGETCVLQSAKGFFENVKIREMNFTGDTKTD